MVNIPSSSHYNEATNNDINARNNLILNNSYLYDGLFNDERHNKNIIEISLYNNINDLLKLNPKIFIYRLND